MLTKVKCSYLPSSIEMAPKLSTEHMLVSLKLTCAFGTAQWENAVTPWENHRNFQLSFPHWVSSASLTRLSLCKSPSWIYCILLGMKCRFLGNKDALANGQLPVFTSHKLFILKMFFFFIFFFSFLSFSGPFPCFSRHFIHFLLSSVSLLPWLWKFQRRKRVSSECAPCSAHSMVCALTPGCSAHLL